MTKFELFTMIFYVLDASWYKSHDEALGQFCSSANPFLFTDCGSADPAVFSDFCASVPDEITLEASHDVAQVYIDGLHNPAVSKGFTYLTAEEWMDFAKEYLASPHKGE